MKQLITFLIVLTISISSYGQTVNIPDEEFLDALIKLGVDTNGDELIQLAEAEAVDTLSLGSGFIYWGKISTMEGISAFKNLTYLYCHSDSLSTLDLSLNLKLSYLNCSRSKLATLDLSSNALLSYLDYSYNNITTIDLSSNTLLTAIVCDGNGIVSLDDLNISTLEKLSIQGNEIASLDLSPFPNLTYLNCRSTGITSLDLGPVPLLTELNCRFNDLESLDLSSVPFLVELNCSDNRLEYLDINQVPLLTSLRCEDNSLTSLDITSVPHLDFLLCGYNDISLLDLSNVPLLTYLDCQVNNINTLHLNFVPLLRTLRCRTNGLAIIDLSYVPGLRRLELGWNQVTTLDLNSVPELLYLKCHNNPIKSINTTNNPQLQSLKIGGSSFQSINMLDNVNTTVDIYLNLNGLKYLCADSGEIDDFEDFVNLNNLIVNEYCPDDYHPAVNAGGTILYSETIDECTEASPISNDFEFEIEYEADKSFVHYSLGHSYDVGIPSNTLSTIRMKNLNLDIFEVTPEFHQISTETDVDSLDFCISTKGLFVSDVNLNVYTLDDPIPGFEHSYVVDYNNLGNVSSDGVILFKYNPEIMHIIEYSNSWNMLPGKLEMNYSDLLPLEKRTSKITFLLNSPLDSISLESGDNLLISCSLIPQEDDIDMLNNNVFLNENLTNSFDPNDKSCLQGDIIFQDSLHKPLTYRIRFENKGTAPARNITIQDIVDPTIFDPSSIQILSASHSFDLIVRESVLEFNFFDINLPFENELNDGYVIFSLNVIDGLVPGDIIENEASIYFDFNWPIYTNIASSEVVVDLDGDGFHNLDDCDDSDPNINPNAEEIPNNEIDEDCDGVALTTSIHELGNSIINIYPNPAIDMINIDVEEGVTFKTSIYNFEGEVIHVSSNTNSIQIQFLPTGIYLLEIQDLSTGQKITEKIVKGI